jgi:hypothetical protein
MSKKQRLKHPPLSEDVRFKGLTREQLLTLVTLPVDLPSGVIGKYHMRVESAKRENSFCTPKWLFAGMILKRGKYVPKTDRGIFDLICQSVDLFGPEGLTGEQLVRFIHSNIDMRDQRSPYTEGRPCVPWIEDYITGAISEKLGFLIAVGQDGTVYVPKK